MPVTGRVQAVVAHELSTVSTTPEDPRWNERDVFGDHQARVWIGVLALEIRALKDKIREVDEGWSRRYDTLRCRYEELEFRPDSLED